MTTPRRFITVTVISESKKDKAVVVLNEVCLDVNIDKYSITGNYIGTIAPIIGGGYSAISAAKGGREVFDTEPQAIAYCIQPANPDNILVEIIDPNTKSQKVVEPIVVQTHESVDDLRHLI